LKDYGRAGRSGEELKNERHDHELNGKLRPNHQYKNIDCGLSAQRCTGQARPDNKGLIGENDARSQ